MTSTYRPADSKREEYRKYLEKTGVMDSLTKVLVGLYEEAEKPNNPLEYIRKHLSDKGTEVIDIDVMIAEHEEFKNKIQLLEAEVADLKSKLLIYEPPEEETQQGASE